MNEQFNQAPPKPSADRCPIPPPAGIGALRTMAKAVEVASSDSSL